MKTIRTLSMAATLFMSLVVQTGYGQDTARQAIRVGNFSIQVPIDRALARSDQSGSTVRVGIRRDQLASNLHSLASAGASATITHTAPSDLPAWQTELWARDGRHADFRFEAVGRTRLYRAYHPVNPGIWTIVSTVPTEGPMPPDFVVADCGGGEDAPAMCRSTFWLAPDLMVEYSYDARDLARRGEIEQYLTAQIRSWMQPE